MDANLFQPGLFDRYAARPQEDEFEKMTLAHFSVWYDSVYRDDTPKGSSGRHIQPRFKLQGNLGWIKLRTKQACLRTLIVYVKFHDPRVGQFTKVCILIGQQEAVAIEPLSVRFNGRQGTVLQRTQIPLILCWAATLHKVQCLSLDSAVLDFRESV